MTQPMVLTTADAGTVARAEKAAKVYGLGEAGVRALDDVSIAIPGAELTAIMGPSGSGKSTLLHCMAGLDSLTRGQVFLGDRDLAQLSDRELTLVRRDRIGFVFQAFNLVPTLSALDNIRLPFTLGGRDPDRAWLEEVVATVGLDGRLAHRPAELSGGEQQRVAVARALVTRPEIVFADEPTGNLDSRSSGEVLGLLRRAVDQFAQTVVMVTHDPVAAAFADSVAFLSTADWSRRCGIRPPNGWSIAWPDWGVDVVRLTVASLWARRRRFASVFAAVILGVAFLTGTLVLGDTLSRNFDRLFTNASAGTDVVVRNSTVVQQTPNPDQGRALIDEALLRTVRAVPGVAQAQGQVSGNGTLLGRDGTAIGGGGPPQLAGSWVTVSALNPYRLVQGRAPERRTKWSSTGGRLSPARSTSGAPPPS